MVVFELIEQTDKIIRYNYYPKDDWSLKSENGLDRIVK